MNDNRQLRRIGWCFMLLAGLCAFSGVELAWPNAMRANAGDTPVSEKKTVAVFPLANLSNDSRLAPITEAIADLLTVRLSRENGLVLVERTEIDRVMREQALANSTKENESLRLGKVLGARFVLSGSILHVDDELVITAHLVEVTSKRVAKSIKVQTRPNHLDRVVGRLADDLMRGLDLELPELTDDQIDNAPEANLHFMRGLGMHFSRMQDEAIVSFLKALAIDPQHARARFWCGIVYADAGETEHARIELTRFVKQFPQHPLAPRAQKWLAESDRK